MTEFVIDELRRYTEYKVWVLAGTSVGDGPKSYPLIVQTQEDGKYCKTYSIRINTDKRLTEKYEKKMITSDIFLKVKISLRDIRTNFDP